MCHREGGESVGEELGREAKLVSGDTNNNNNLNTSNNNNNNTNSIMAGGFLASSGWGEPRAFCPCMTGDRRIRRRHPATVQTPGRSLAEGEVMEPLVTNRLQGERVGSEPMRDYNDNYSCDQEKFYEVQFAMDFSHLRTGSNPPRFGNFDECATSENLKKNRILTSKLK